MRFVKLFCEIVRFPKLFCEIVRFPKLFCEIVRSYPPLADPHYGTLMLQRSILETAKGVLLPNELTMNVIMY